jgi:hypothetical protein
MKPTVCAHDPNKSPAVLGGTGGAFQSHIQLGLDGIDPPPKFNCSPLKGDLARFVRLLKSNPQGVPCSEGRKVSSTYLPNHARTLRDVYSIDLRTVRVDAPTVDKPKAWYGLYLLTQTGWQQVEQLPLSRA